MVCHLVKPRTVCRKFCVNMAELGVDRAWFLSFLEEKVHDEVQFP